MLLIHEETCNSKPMHSDKTSEKDQWRIKSRSNPCNSYLLFGFHTSKKRISKIGQLMETNLMETNFFLGDSCFHYNQKDLEWLNSKRVSLPMLRRWWCHWAWCRGLLQAPRFRSSFLLQKAKLETLIFSPTVVWLATTCWNEMCILPWDFTDRCHGILLHKSQCL